MINNFRTKLNIVLSNVSNDSEKKFNEIGCKYINEFKKQSIEERIKISNSILNKYPTRIPIIVDCKKEIIIDKNKYIVPNDLSIAQFIYILKKRINLNYEQSIFLLCNNLLVINTELIYDLYHKQKSEDGFLYIIISLENTFGN
jgi:GABA(A) receptor-associated protein